MDAHRERSLIEHGSSVYRARVHVPLLVKWPGASLARTIDAPVSVADILSTDLEVAGVDMPDGLDGRSLRAAALPPSSSAPQRPGSRPPGIAATRCSTQRPC